MLHGSYGNYGVMRVTPAYGGSFGAVGATAGMTDWFSDPWAQAKQMATNAAIAGGQAVTGAGMQAGVPGAGQAWTQLQAEKTRQQATQHQGDIEKQAANRAYWLKVGLGVVAVALLVDSVGTSLRPRRNGRAWEATKGAARWAGGKAVHEQKKTLRMAANVLRLRPDLVAGQAVSDVQNVLESATGERYTAAEVKQMARTVGIPIKNPKKRRKYR